RAYLQQAAEGHFLRASASATVRDRTALQHGSAAAAGAVAEDAAQYRGTRPPAVSGARPVENRTADPAAVDARAHEPARGAQAHAYLSARAGRDCQDAAAARARCDPPDRRGTLSPARGVGRHRSTAPGA